MSRLLCALVRNYLRLVGWYVDRHDCTWPNQTAGDDER